MLTNLWFMISVVMLLAINIGFTFYNNNDIENPNWMMDYFSVR